MKPRMRSKMWVFNAFGMLGKSAQVQSHNTGLIYSHLIRSIQHCHNSEFCFVSFDPERPQTIEGFTLIDWFHSRIAHLDNNGMCVIGMERPALLPLIIFDLVVNVGTVLQIICHLY